jgi:hypothetical protein
LIILSNISNSLVCTIEGVLPIEECLSVSPLLTRNEQVDRTDFVRLPLTGRIKTTISVYPMAFNNRMATIALLLLAAGEVTAAAAISWHPSYATTAAALRYHSGLASSHPKH